MKLSVIVPACQVEAYLPACLEALLDQDMGDYEIICVDDGSTDRTGEIARDYARRRPQVAVICQPNGGLSAARNAGLRAASGEYVYFMDADDVLARGVLGPLCRLAEEERLDQLLFDYARFENGAAPPLSAGVDPGRLRRYRDPLEMRRDPAVPAWRTAWNYLIRRAVLEEYGLRFPVGALFEDAEFNFWLDRCAGRCGYLDQKLYGYRRRADSIVATFMDDSRFPGYIQGRLGLAESHLGRLRAFRAGRAPRLRVPVTEAELETRLIDEVQGILNRLLAKGDRALLERTLEELRDRGLYPYPLRWRRLVRREDLTKRAVDAASFLYPAAWYLRLWVRLRTRRT
ncbi:MAG: glycosyltransferase [Oscillospiraceae bacterium]|nr:glycosyltransferase [Oscillospiraceae bacterium]